MEKQKTSFWKTHPLLKAITVLVGFYLLLYCPEQVPFLYTISYILGVYYYFGGLMYLINGLYGVWIDRKCHLKFLSFCLVLIVLTILLCYFVFLNVYPSWKINGYILWDYVHNALFFASGQMFSVLGGYILSKVTSYFVNKYRKTKEITD